MVFSKLVIWLGLKISSKAIFEIHRQSTLKLCKIQTIVTLSILITFYKFFENLLQP